jgi:hypothetical protein
MSGVEAGADTHTIRESQSGFVPAAGASSGKSYPAPLQRSLQPAVPDAGRPVSASPFPERRRARALDRGGAPGPGHRQPAPGRQERRP